MSSYRSPATIVVVRGALCEGVCVYITNVCPARICVDTTVIRLIITEVNPTQGQEKADVFSYYNRPNNGIPRRLNRRSSVLPFGVDSQMLINDRLTEVRYILCFLRIRRHFLFPVSGLGCAILGVSFALRLITMAVIRAEYHIR